jgi:hypothetical protein
VVKVTITQLVSKKLPISMVAPEMTVVELSPLDLPGVRFVSLMVVQPPQFLVRLQHLPLLLVLQMLL